MLQCPERDCIWITTLLHNNAVRSSEISSHHAPPLSPPLLVVQQSDGTRKKTRLETVTTSLEHVSRIFEDVCTSISRLDSCMQTRGCWHVRSQRLVLTFVRPYFYHLQEVRLGFVKNIDIFGREITHNHTQLTILRQKETQELKDQNPIPLRTKRFKCPQERSRSYIQTTS